MLTRAFLRASATANAITTKTRAKNVKPAMRLIFDLSLFTILLLYTIMLIFSRKEKSRLAGLNANSSIHDAFCDELLILLVLRDVLDPEVHEIFVSLQIKNF